jgi:protoporphyrinogen oxidase
VKNISGKSQINSPLKIAVIGSGISGLSIAQLLHHDHDITVYEKGNLAGGLIQCLRVKDCLFHKVGGHVFNAKNKEVLNWFWSFFDKDKEFVLAKRNAKILLDEQIIGYPIENYIYQLPKAIIEDILHDFAVLSKVGSKKADNFLEFIINRFGRTLSELYFIPYNEKVWATDLSKVPMGWLEGKLPMPDIDDIILKNILRQEETDMVHSSFYYPVEDGSQFIVNRLRKDLNIQFNSDFDAIEDSLLFGKLKFDKIVFCGDIRKLPLVMQKILIKNNINIDRLKKLKTNGTSNIFCETDETDISWLYLPGKLTKAHRIIYTGNFSETNNRGSNRKTCVVEFTGKISYEGMSDEIKKLPGNLIPLSHNYQENSYIIHDHDTHNLISEVKKILEEHNIYLLGRFAEWKYYNMDKAIEGAIHLAKRINNL